LLIGLLGKNSSGGGGTGATLFSAESPLLLLLKLALLALSSHL
jgi:hypothetical protein